MMNNSLIFNKKDFAFIEENYSDLYRFLNIKAFELDGLIYYPLFDEDEYEETFQKFYDEIIKLNGNKDNKRLESIFNSVDISYDRENPLLLEKRKAEIRKYIYRDLRKKPIDAPSLPSPFERNLNQVEWAYFMDFIFKCNDLYSKGLIAVYEIY